MAFEKSWQAVPVQAFTADGTQFGLVTVADTIGFKVKQKVILSVTLPSPSNIQFQVKRVLSNTQLIVGLPDNKIGPDKGSDISAYTVANGATIYAVEQSKNNIPDKDHYEAIYEADPIVADRVIMVDPYGDYYGSANPLPIAFDGTIAVGNVTIQDDDGDELEINPDGSINVNIVSGTSSNVIKNTYGEASAVPAGIETTITTYMVPLMLSSALLQRISVSGENVGRYRVFLNSVVVDTRRTYYGGAFNEYFEFSIGSGDGMVLVPGDVVEVKILHDRPFVGNFQARIQALEIV